MSLVALVAGGGVNTLMGEIKSGPCFLLLSVPSPTDDKKIRQRLRTTSVFLGT